MYNSKINSGYILQRSRYKEKSYLLKFLTDDNEVLDLVLNTGKKNFVGSLIQPFNLIKIEWKKSKFGTLHTVNSVEMLENCLDVSKTMHYKTFLCAFYVTELLLKTKIVNYLKYQQTINFIKNKDNPSILYALRIFELNIIQESGLGFDISIIQPNKHYAFDTMHGLKEATSEQYDCIQGNCILNLINSNYSLSDLKYCKIFFAKIIDEILDGYKLKSKILLKKYYMEKAY